MQIYNEKEQSEQSVQFEEKRNTGGKSTEKPDAKWNKGSGDLRARPHPAKLPTCEKELKKSLSNKENHQNQKADENVFE